MLEPLPVVVEEGSRVMPSIHVLGNVLDNTTKLEAFNAFCMLKIREMTISFSKLLQNLKDDLLTDHAKN